MSGINRSEVVRIDCPQCLGNGYMVDQNGNEEPCDKCEGLGLWERKVPFTGEKRSKQELKNLFGVENPTLRSDPDATK